MSSHQVISNFSEFTLHPKNTYKIMFVALNMYVYLFWLFEKGWKIHRKCCYFTKQWIVTSWCEVFLMVSATPCIFMYTNHHNTHTHPLPCEGGGVFMPKLRCSRRWPMVLAREFWILCHPKNVQYKSFLLGPCLYPCIYENHDIFWITQDRNSTIWDIK